MAPWGNWHLWFGRLWERAGCMAQLGTLDYGRKRRHPEVGRDEEPWGQPLTPQTANLEVLGRGCLWRTEMSALSSTGTDPNTRGSVTPPPHQSHKAADPPGGSLCLREAREGRIPCLGLVILALSHRGRWLCLQVAPRLYPGSKSVTD